MRKLLIKSEGVNFANQFTTIFESANTYTVNIDRGWLWDMKTHISFPVSQSQPLSLFAVYIFALSKIEVKFN